jgi:predicted DNA-binding transcriptional regulator AlpA
LSGFFHLQRRSQRTAFSLDNPQRILLEVVMPHQILRPEQAWKRLGVKRSTFYREFVATGRLRLVKLGERARGVLEHELDHLIDELAAERDAV